MKEVKVLGTGCAKCKTLVAMVEQAAMRTGTAIDLEKVEDMARIIGYGVMATPALVIEGRVVHSGSLPEPGTIDRLLQES